ncbi:heme-binding domain-containing protein [Flavivirga aquimarina]|uniref:Heme-binding domain-containing protein n=1 Tax=Flavivirga aquimarina TaxID=2027862 RepID=A0ABT8WBL7_9FLAO|nr:heme-binding domain-containing protein [Flavivirga aquimarina]MDO5970448.1 heme-binding domain-containing protein [Flavivirga aquimarina]
MKKAKKILVILLIALVLIQFYRPEKNNAEYLDVAAFEAETKPGKDVAAILKAQCYDCHSNKTEYPWYAEIAPISFWLDDHIKDGSKHFNVSKWDTYKDKKKDHKLEELIEEVEAGEMPLKSYTWIHGSITQEDKEALIVWAKKARENYHLE